MMINQFNMTAKICWRPLKVVIAFFLFFQLVACAEPAPEPLRIASSPWPGYEPLYLARDLGYLDKKTTRLFELPSADITMESFRNHSADVATLTLDEIMELLHDGTHLRILLIMDISHGGDAVLARPEIKDLTDIKGKRISIVNIPLGLFMLNRLLSKAGLQREDVSVFPMSDSKQVSFYKNNEADVVITFEPYKTQLKNLGANLIFDSRDIPNEIFDILVVHEDVYHKRKSDLCGVVNAWFKALKYMREYPDDAAVRITRRLGMKVEEYGDLMDGIIIPDQYANKSLLSGNPPGLHEPAEKLSTILLSEKHLTRKVSLESSIDAEFASNCF